MSSPARRPHGTGREAILRATVQVVAELGLRGLTFRAVAARAGVNNTLIAHYFGTRESLIEAALEWSVERSIGLSHLEEFATSPTDFVTQLAETLTQDAELQAYQYEMILEARRKDELRGAIRRLYDSYEATITGSLEAIGITGLDSSGRRALFGAIDGLVLQRVSGNISDEEFRSALERVFGFVQQTASAR
ncbi:MAG: TetR/AcrR family transcriptional regulator [Leucobacter sp.]